MIYCIVVSCLAALNTLSFILFGYDKRQAKKRQWRVPEGVLLGVCFLGGAAGGYIGMHVFHHKTKKPVFAVGVPLFITAHMILIYFIIR